MFSPVFPNAVEQLLSSCPFSSWTLIHAQENQHFVSYSLSSFYHLAASYYLGASFPSHSFVSVLERTRRNFRLLTVKPLLIGSRHSKGSKCIPYDVLYPSDRRIIAPSCFLHLCSKIEIRKAAEGERTALVRPQD